MITRRDIENTVLSCFLNQTRTIPLDEMEFVDYRIPYELFKATRTNKLIAKAIFNLQENKSVIDDDIVLDYIRSNTDVNANEFLEVTCTNWVSFDTCKKYIEKLKEEDRKYILQGI